MDGDTILVGSYLDNQSAYVLERDQGGGGHEPGRGGRRRATPSIRESPS